MPIIAVYGIIAAVIFGAGAGSGWMVNGWRNGETIERLESSNAVFIAANSRCVSDIEDARKSILQVTKAADDKRKAAEVEMKKAEPKAATHTERAITILAAPIKSGDQCEAIIQEQFDYVASRSNP